MVHTVLLHGLTDKGRKAGQLSHCCHESVGVAINMARPTNHNHRGLVWLGLMTDVCGCVCG